MKPTRKGNAMTATKRARYIQNGEKFQHNGHTYRAHATFMEGYADTRITVTDLCCIYNRFPIDLTLNNQTVVTIL